MSPALQMTGPPLVQTHSQVIIIFQICKHIAYISKFGKTSTQSMSKLSLFTGSSSGDLATIISD